MHQLDEKTEVDLDPPDAPDNFTTIPAAAPTLPSEPDTLLLPELPKAPNLPSRIFYNDP